MSSKELVNTHGRTRLSFASEADIDEFVDTLEKYERGEMTADQWRAFRLVRGTYGQRQSYDASMLRVKIPQGVLSSAQLYALAEAGEKYSRRFGHITTRQNIQFHFIKLHDIEKAMHLLADAGMTTREACGNSVRNITTCPHAGVAADEFFDVTPYAEATTRFLLRHPLAAILPRKFKIAFEGCPDDHTVIAINDLAFHARIEGGVRGFRVYAGGGTAIMCRSAGVIHEFIPASDLYRVSEALLRVFREHGDFIHKQRNRLKFMIKTLGWDKFVAEYEKNLAACRAEGVPDAVVEAAEHESAPQQGERPEPPAPNLIVARVAAAPPNGPGIVPALVPVFAAGDESYARWKLTNTRPQKQFGFIQAIASVPLGDLTSEQMRVLAELASAYGDGSVRVTVDQDLVFRWVPVGDLRELYRRLAAAGLGLAEAGSVADVTSCPGAESCRLAVTQSRGLGKLLEDHLRARPDLIAAADGARIKISGCPNGCGQHHIATIGFQGSVRKVAGKSVPQYFVMVGGGTTTAGASFGRTVAKIPARRIADAVERLIALYQREKAEGESAVTFFQRLDNKKATAELDDLQRFTAEDATPVDYIDLAETTEFAPEVMEGECSA